MIPSIEEFERLLTVAASSMDIDLDDPTPISTMLTELHAFDVSLVDPTKPMAFAIGMTSGDAPGFTPVLILPASDPAALLASVETADGIAAPLLQGDYVGIPQGTTYATTDTPHALTQDMGASVMHVRFDLEALLETFGPMIDAQLSSMRGMFESMQDEDMGMDVGLLMGVYLDAISSGMDSVEGLDLEVTLAGSTLEFFGDLHLLPGSTLSAFHSEQPMNLKSMLACLDMKASVTTLMGMDGEQYLQQAQPFMDALMQAYPEELRTVLTSTMATYKDIYPLVDGPMAISFDLEAEGMRMASYTESTQAENLQQAMLRVLTTQKDILKEVGVLIGDPVETSIAGVDVQQFDWTMDGTDLPAEMKELSAAMSSVYGETMVMTLAANDERVFVGAGNSIPFLEASIERIGREGSGSAHEFEYLAGRLEGSNPVMITQLDVAKFGALVQRVSGISRDSKASPSPLRMTFFAAMRKDSMSGGLRVDLDEVKAFTQGIEERKQTAIRARDEIETSLKSIQEGADPALVAGELERLVDDLTGSLGDPGGKVPNMKVVKEAVRALKKEHASDSKMMKLLGPALDRMFERTQGTEATGEFEYDLF